MDDQSNRERLLYQKYGRPLETDHMGDYVAISPEGKTVYGPRAGEVLRQAIDAFGSGNFGLFRLGHRAFAAWLAAI